MELQGKRILLTGGAGFLGKRVADELVRRGADPKKLTIPRRNPKEEEFETSIFSIVRQDLRSKEYCEGAVSNKDIVIHCAGNVGGIGKNQKKPGTLLYDNLIMGAQLIEAARQAGVAKFVTVGTICSYPKFTEVPFKESDLWNGYPEETNAPYGLAKKMLLAQGQAYRQEFGMNVIHLLPVNLYGPGDNFDPESSHVIPALIHKLDQAIRTKAKTVSIWGSGKATREFLFVDDAARGIVTATERYDGPEPVNLGSGMEISIRKLYGLLRTLMVFTGRAVYDKTKPDGQPRRSLDTSRAKELFDWKAETPFREGLDRTVDWYYKNFAPVA